MDGALRLEALLEHADWVRRLAHSLVADPARADDVAQETWLAALQAPPRDARNLRAWLGSVVRNAAKRSARSSARRDAHEQSAARDEALPSAAELVEQADLQRELASLVIALDEPYRQTLLLRYYRGLSAEEIAERSGVPLNTVRTRLQRGLGQLRERLDRRFGERSQWLSALAPLLRSPLAPHVAVQGSLLSSLGVLIMAAKVKWLAAAVAVLLGLWLWWSREASVAPTGELASVPKAEPHTTETPAAAESALLDHARVALTPTRTAPLAQSAPPRIVSSISGRCVDLFGAPVAGLEIEWFDYKEDQLIEALHGAEYHRPSVRTELNGTFHIEQESEGGEIGPTRSDLMLIDDVHVAEFPETLYVVVPCVELAGSVVDSERAGIVGASVAWHFSLDAVRSFPYVIPSSKSVTNGVDCDEQGSFLLAPVPSATGCELQVSARGFVGTSLKVPEHSVQGLTFTLTAEPRDSKYHIAGRVIHRDRLPAVGARVDFFQYGSTAGKDGSFYIGLPQSAKDCVPEGTPLTAYLKGARPAALLDFVEQMATRESAIDDALLVLDEPLPPIRGRVLDAAGTPCVDWGVALIDAQPQGTTSETLEAAACGDRADQSTDTEGRFHFGGLLDHAYRVRAWNSKNMVAIESELVPPGSNDLILRVPADVLIERVVGRVISRRGLPIGGAVISVGLVTREVEVAGLPDAFRTMIFHEGTRADAQGRFELHGVPRNRCLIGASDDRIESNSIEFDPSMADKELLIEVDLKLRFRVEPRRAGEFDHFQVLDHAGEDVSIEEIAVGGYTNDVELIEGAFPLCSVDESGEILVLFLADREIRRITLALRPGEITTVRP